MRIAFVFLIFFVACRRPATTTEGMVRPDGKIEQMIQRLKESKLLPIDTLRAFYDSVQVYAPADSLSISRKAFIEGTYFSRNGNYHLSKATHQNAIRYAVSNDSLTAAIHSQLGMVNRQLGDYTNAIFHFQKSISIGESLHDTLLVAGNYASIAQLDFEKDNIERSRQNIEKVFDLLGKYRFTKPNLVALHTLTNIEGSTGNYHKAMEIDAKAIAMCKENNSPENMVPFQDNLARCYMQYLHDYRMAKHYFLKNLEIDKKLNNPSWIADTYINLAELSAYEKQFDSAQYYLNEAKKTFDETQQLNNQLKYYQAVENVFKMANHLPKMYDAKTNYINLYKKYINEKNEQLFQAYNVLFETADKEKKLSETRLLLAEEQLESKRKTFGLIVLVFIILAGSVVFRTYRQNARLRDEKHAYEKQLTEEQAKLKIQHQRMEISQDLHDNMGAQLSFISSILNDAAGCEDELQRQTKISKAAALTGNAVTELRNTLWVLQSAAPEVEGLKEKMLNFMHRAAEAKEEIEFEFDHTILHNASLDSKTALHLFRIFQEIVNNAVKYSKASRITTQLTSERDQIILLVKDNGIGFDIQKTEGSSYGMSNIRSRAAEIGDLELESSPDGTMYLIKIPLHDKSCNR